MIWLFFCYGMMGYDGILRVNTKSGFKHAFNDITLYYEF